MENDVNLLQLRTKIEWEANLPKSEVESFMHQSLRPILKSLNKHLILVVQGYIHERKWSSIHEHDESKYRPNLVHSLKTDQKFRQLLIGLVVSRMTINEINFFLENKSELTKRIISMIETRIFS
jgi:hypothetical protein